MEDTCKQARARTPCRAPVSPVPLMQSFTRFCCCCYSKGTKRFSKTRGASKLSLTWRSRTLACSQPSRQPPPHPASKKSRTFIEVSDCSPHRRLRAFVRMVWVTKNKGQHGGANKCAQDGYLRLVEADPSLLSCSLGAPPSDLLHFLRVRPADLETKR